MQTEQEILLRTLAKDSNSLSHNEALQPESVTIHSGKISLPGTPGTVSAPQIKKSKAPLLSLIFVFCLTAGPSHT
jgi:hypothetical protein